MLIIENGGLRMGWWKRVLGRAKHKSLDGAMYRVTSTLYSSDGIADIANLRPWQDLGDIELRRADPG